MDSIVTLFMLAVAALELSAAAYYSCKAIEQAQSISPRAAKERLRAASAFDKLLRSGTAPIEACRDYLLAHVFASVGFTCLAVLAATQGPILGSLLFTGITMLAIGDTWLCWRKYCALRD